MEPCAPCTYQSKLVPTCRPWVTKQFPAIFGINRLLPNSMISLHVVHIVVSTHTTSLFKMDVVVCHSDWTGPGHHVLLPSTEYICNTLYYYQCHRNERPGCKYYQCHYRACTIEKQRNNAPSVLPCLQFMWLLFDTLIALRFDLWPMACQLILGIKLAKCSETQLLPSLVQIMTLTKQRNLSVYHFTMNVHLYDIQIFGLPYWSMIP